jgi:hypothetical protein
VVQAMATSRHAPAGDAWALTRSPQTAQQPRRLVSQQVVSAAQQLLGKPFGQRVSPAGHVTLCLFFFLFLRFFLASVPSPISEATAIPTAARNPPATWRRLPDRDGTVLVQASNWLPFIAAFLLASERVSHYLPMTLRHAGMCRRTGWRVDPWHARQAVATAPGLAAGTGVLDRAAVLILRRAVPGKDTLLPEVAAAVAFALAEPIAAFRSGGVAGTVRVVATLHTVGAAAVRAAWVTLTMGEVRAPARGQRCRGRLRHLGHSALGPRPRATRAGGQGGYPAAHEDAPIKRAQSSARRCRRCRYCSTHGSARSFCSHSDKGLHVWRSRANRQCHRRSRNIRCNILRKRNWVRRCHDKTSRASCSYMPCLRTSAFSSSASFSCDAFSPRCRAGHAGER